MTQTEQKNIDFRNACASTLNLFKNIESFAASKPILLVELLLICFLIDHLPSVAPYTNFFFLVVGHDWVQLILNRTKKKNVSHNYLLNQNTNGSLNWTLHSPMNNNLFIHRSVFIHKLFFFDRKNLIYGK